MRGEFTPDLLGIEPERAKELYLLVVDNPGKIYELANELEEFDESLYVAYIAGEITNFKRTSN